MRKSLVTAEPAGTATPATGCWRRSASSPKSSWPPPASSTKYGTATPATSPTGPMRSWSCGRAHSSWRRINGSTASSPTFERGSAGQPATMTCTVPPASRISTSIVGVWIQRYEQFAWAEELLDSAIHHGVRRLPSLYTAAAHCFLTGRIDDSLRFGRAAVDLNDQPEYDPVPFAYCYLVLGSTYSYAGQLDRNLQTAAACRQRSDDRLTAGPSQLAFGLAVAKRFDEAQTMAEEAVSATTASGIPSQIAFALVAYGRAFAETDPAQALVAMRRGLAVARASDNRWQEAMVGTELAALETARRGRQRRARDAPPRHRLAVSSGRRRHARLLSVEPRRGL